MSSDLDLDLDALLGRLADLVADRVSARLGHGNGNGHSPAGGTDKLLSAVEAATKLHVTVRWMYEHAAGLPFTVRLPGRSVRFDAAGLERWIAKRQAHSHHGGMR